jgi:hypothetical protein
MNRQEMFSKAVSGVIAQGGPSRKDGKCLYRGPNGRKCIVGYLIKDEDYTTEMDNIIDRNGSGVSNLNALKMLPKYLKGHVVFLVELQGLHDMMIFDYNLDEFIAECRLYATANKLKMPT